MRPDSLLPVFLSRSSLQSPIRRIRHTRRRRPRGSNGHCPRARARLVFTRFRAILYGMISVTFIGFKKPLMFPKLSLERITARAFAQQAREPTACRLSLPSACVQSIGTKLSMFPRHERQPCRLVDRSGGATRACSPRSGGYRSFASILVRCSRIRPIQRIGTSIACAVSCDTARSDRKSDAFSDSDRADRRETAFDRL